jgi:hypothetical protein
MATGTRQRLRLHRRFQRPRLVRWTSSISSTHFTMRLVKDMRRGERMTCLGLIDTECPKGRKKSSVHSRTQDERSWTFIAPGISPLLARFVSNLLIHECKSHLTFLQESVVVSRQALEEWLSVKWHVSVLEHSDGAGPSAHSRESSAAYSTPSERSCTDSIGQPEQHLTQKIIDTDSILCPHGKLDPQKAHDMKRISQVNWSLNITVIICSAMVLLYE